MSPENWTTFTIKAEVPGFCSPSSRFRLITVLTAAFYLNLLGLMRQNAGLILLCSPEMKEKNLILLLIVAVSLPVTSATAIPQGKYQQIEGIRGAYPFCPWVGLFIRVEDCSWISGFAAPDIIFCFPECKAISVGFSPDNEKAAIKVDSIYCRAHWDVTGHVLSKKNLLIEQVKK